MKVALSCVVSGIGRRHRLEETLWSFSLVLFSTRWSSSFFILNLSCFKSDFCLFQVSFILTLTFSIFCKLILYYSSSLSRLAWSSPPSSTRSTLTLKKPQSFAWCSTLGASPAQSQRLTYQVAGSFALVMKWRKFTFTLSGIYYAFWCHPGLQYFYMLTVLGFILCGLIFRNTFNKDENLIPRYFALHLFQVDHAVDCNWSISQADLFHHLCHLRLCAHHPLGLAQWNWKRRGSSQIIRFSNSYLLILHIQTRLFLPRVLIMYLLAGLAFVFYIAKFPEVVLPGRYITPSFTRPKTSTDLTWKQLICLSYITACY